MMMAQGNAALSLSERAGMGREALQLPGYPLIRRPEKAENPVTIDLPAYAPYNGFSVTPDSEAKEEH